MSLAKFQHRVRTLTFAKEQVFTEEEIAGGDRAIDVGRLHVVHVNPAALDVFAGLAFGRAETAVDEEFDWGIATEKL